VRKRIDGLVDAEFQVIAAHHHCLFFTVCTWPIGAGADSVVAPWCSAATRVHPSDAPSGYLLPIIPRFQTLGAATVTILQQLLLLRDTLPIAPFIVTVDCAPARVYGMRDCYPAFGGKHMRKLPPTRHFFTFSFALAFKSSWSLLKAKGTCPRCYKSTQANQEDRESRHGRATDHEDLQLQLHST